MHKVTKEDKKKFQLADWAARPISKEMMEYAAHDSHFLIHIA